MLFNRPLLFAMTAIGLTTPLHWTWIQQSIGAVPATEPSDPSATASSVRSEDTPSRRVMWVDFDADGHLDAHVLRGAESYLLRNTGNGEFENVTETAGLGELGPVRFVLWEDYDQNGTVDLFVGHFAGSGALFANQGNGSLKEVTESSGLEELAPAHSAEWFDFDADGWKDLWIENVGGVTLLRNASGVGFDVVELDLPAAPPISTAPMMAPADQRAPLTGGTAAPSSGTSLPPSGRSPILRSQSAPTTLPPTGTASAAAGQASIFDSRYVNDNQNEVDSADVIDGSLVGADVSTTSGDVSHTGGRVDIGEVGSSSIFDVVGPTSLANSGTTPALTVEGSGFFAADGGSLADTVGKGVRIFTDSSTSDGHIFAYDYGSTTDGNGPVLQPLDLILQQPGGRVGIGTASPATALDVDGAITIRGGADIVERFDVSGENVEPGTVLVIDPENAGNLMVSGEPYDVRVAGIVSGAGGVKAGICLGQEGVMDGEIPVAMTGRVYVKASTENGLIRPGDRLTTASLAGHAMKVTDSTSGVGSVIGKAMTSLDDETGLVLVLVNLQ